MVSPKKEKSQIQHLSLQFHSYIVVFEEAQHPQLSEDPLTGDKVLEDIGHFLQRHLATVTWICDRPVRNHRKLSLKPFGVLNK